MGAAELLQQVRTAGLRLYVADGKLLVTPASMLTDALRAALRARMPEMLELLAEAHQTTVKPLAAAIKVCDLYGDSEAAREEMRQQCLELPPQLQADLLDHFTRKPRLTRSQARRGLAGTERCHYFHRRPDLERPRP